MQPEITYHDTYTSAGTKVPWLGSDPYTAADNASAALGQQMYPYPVEPLPTWFLPVVAAMWGIALLAVIVLGVIGR